jgi:hypothetical protein
MEVVQQQRTHCTHKTKSFFPTEIQIAYGIDILPENDPYIATAEFAVGLLGSECNPESHLVNTIPICDDLPYHFYVLILLI